MYSAWWLRWIVAPLCVLATLGAASAEPAGAVHLHKVASFNAPVYVTAPPGGRGLLFVVEQSGEIRVVRHGHKLARPFLDISSRVVSGGEQGLLSMAFAPDYARSGRFYVAYTNHDCVSGACNLEVDGFRRSRHSRVRAIGSSREKVIEVVHHQAGNHNAGQLQFGPDGHLYISTGDGGTEGDPENDAQSVGSLLGKILRIDPRRRRGYSVPGTNPYVGKPGRDEIFARGLRNPWRFSFDRRTGDLWIGDVGWSTWEEIDHTTLARANGANFGWNIFEGPYPCGACGYPPGTDPPPGYVAPVHWYGHSGGGETGCAIIGGYLVRDRRLGSLDGRYVYTDDCAGDLRAFNPSTGNETSVGVSVQSPSSFGEGPHGSIYVASLGTGDVYRLAGG